MRKNVFEKSAKTEWFIVLLADVNAPTQGRSEMTTFATYIVLIYSIPDVFSSTLFNSTSTIVTDRLAINNVIFGR